MDVYEICGNVTGISDAGVNFLQPGDSYQSLVNGYIYRQELLSRKGFSQFAPRLANGTRVTGIFEYILPDDSKELLATDMNNLYKYNTGTGVFDLIPFGGSMAAYTGFAIVNNEDYISGTAYPTKANTGRFVFTGKGITLNANNSAVFFYDGVSVKDYTNIADNINYVNPPQGQLNRAKFVVYFNERINFVAPRIANLLYAQGQLYSGIRDASGNGDKFNVPGSGLLQLTTSQAISGATILGQLEILNVERGAWLLEITTDAFNPYKFRQMPGVVGTNADFSPVAWYDAVKSMGKTGAVTADGRRSERFDNKIPNFTAKEIDQKEFQLIYGGFDRINGQFLWSYLSGVDDSETQDGVLVYNYEEGTWATFTQRFSVFGQTDLGRDLLWNQIDETVDPSWARWDTTEDIWNEIGLGEAIQKTLAGDDLGFIYEINKDYDDYFATISGITQASSAILTVSASAFQVGDLVTISGVTGMDDINNFVNGEDNKNYVPYVVTAATPTSVTVDYDSSLSAAYIDGGTLTKVISFAAETIPFNPYRSLGLRCFVCHVEFLIDNTGSQLRVDIFDDESETPFKANVLCLPDPTSTKAREWITVEVDQESDFITFRMRQQIPSAQFILTSMRIHCEPGGDS